MIAFRLAAGYRPSVASLSDGGSLIFPDGTVVTRTASGFEVEPPGATKVVKGIGSKTPEPLGTGPLWNTPGLHLPPAVQHIAQELVATKGMTRSHAIATAIAALKRWCAGGGTVKPETRAKACAAVTEWEAAQARAQATPNR